MPREHRLASLRSGDSDYVFATATGRPINARNLVTRGLDKTMERAELSGDGRAKLTWHGLRHLAASMQIAAGYAPEHAARQLGHANSANHAAALLARVRPPPGRRAQVCGVPRPLRRHRGG